MLARILNVSILSLYCLYIAMPFISDKRELHCVRADVFGDLKICFWGARAYRLLFSVGTFGGLAPPPPPPPPPQYQKAGYASDASLCVLCMWVYEMCKIGIYV